MKIEQIIKLAKDGDVYAVDEVCRRLLVAQIRFNTLKRICATDDVVIFNNPETSQWHVGTDHVTVGGHTLEDALDQVLAGRYGGDE